MERLLAALADGATGVRDWSIYFFDSRRLSLGTKDRETGNPHAPLTLAEGQGASYLLVWDDGTISQGSLERRQLEADPRETLAFARMAAYDDPDAAHVLGDAPIPDVRLHDPRAAAIAAGETVVLEHRLERVRLLVEEQGFRTWSGSFSASDSRARLVTSAGLDVSGEGTSTGWFVTLNGELGGGFGGRAPEDDADFEARIGRLARLATELARSADASESGTRPVILHPRVVEEYVLQTLMHHLQGSTVAHGEGRFGRETFGSGASVLREDLGLRLDPLIPLRSGSYRFTREGVPAASCRYVAQGQLIGPIADLKYANRLGVPPSPLPYAMDTLFFEGSDPIDLPQALEQAAGGALVLSVLGVHTQDSASGDFSLSAPQVLALDGRGYCGRIRATISGNLFDVLRDEHLQFVRFEGEHTPGLLFPCRLDPK
jgi:PmbA protein